MKGLRKYLMIVAGVLLASRAIRMRVSTRLQRWVSGPIVAMRDVVHQVME